MRFGLFWQTPGHEGSSIPRRHWETVEEIVLGEKLGFETAWLAESVFYPTRPMSNPLMVAIAAAQHTERIRFGTLAMQTPLHHPFHLASQSATCDILTNGRLDFCLGGRWGARTGGFLGNSTNVSGQESRERVAEAIEIIKLAWTQERFDYQGKYWSAENLPVPPRPMQQPHPPIWIGGHTGPAIRRAAELGDGWMPIGLRPPAILEPEELAVKIARLKRLTVEAGRPEDAVALCFSTYITFQANVGRDRQMMQGRPEQIAADLRQYQDLGVRNFIFGFAGDSVASQQEGMEQFSREVAPLIPQD